jgi:RNA polymerase sigma factor (sigma-70 family)
MCNKIGDLREPKFFSAWLNRIVINEAKRHMKTKYKDAGKVVDISEYEGHFVEKDVEFLPEEWVEREEARDDVMNMVRELPLRQREAVLLRYNEGLNITKSAEVMGVSPSNVSLYLRLAEDKIRKMADKRRSREADAGTAGAATLLTAGAALPRLFEAEAGSISDARVEELMKPVTKYINGAASAKKISTGLIAPVATLLATGAIVIGILFTLPAAREANGIQQIQKEPQVYGADAEYPYGEVIFEGTSPGHGALNPSAATLSTKDGEVSYWHITEAGSETPLQSGDGGTADLSWMAKYGEYEVKFFVQNEAGNTIIVIRPFFVGNA